MSLIKFYVSMYKFDGDSIVKEKKLIAIEFDHHSVSLKKSFNYSCE